MHMHRFERYYVVIASVTVGIFFASVLAAGLIFGINPARPAGFVNPLTLDETEFANPGLRHMGGNRYEAYILAQMWAFAVGSDERLDDGAPVLRVPQHSEVTFFITSRDVTHGMIIEHYNVNLQIVPGHTSSQSITFDRAGTFRAICHEYCGRAHHLMNFAIVVEPANPNA